MRNLKNIGEEIGCYNDLSFPSVLSELVEKIRKTNTKQKFVKNSFYKKKIASRLMPINVANF